MATKTRKPTQFSCSLARAPICPCDALPRGVPGRIAINGEQYRLEVLGYADDLGAEIDGFRLTHLQDDGRTYDIDVSSGVPVCECWDFLRRGHTRTWGCKHTRSILELRQTGVM